MVLLSSSPGLLLSSGLFPLSTPGLFPLSPPPGSLPLLSSLGFTVISQVTNACPSFILAVTIALPTLLATAFPLTIETTLSADEIYLTDFTATSSGFKLNSKSNSSPTVTSKLGFSTTTFSIAGIFPSLVTVT